METPTAMLLFPGGSRTVAEPILTADIMTAIKVVI